MNLTYLLGAGASANTYPVVDDLEGQILKCHDYLIGNDGPQPLLTYLIKAYRNLLEVTSRYGTPDTGSRAMEFAGLDKKLEDLRRDISVFFSTYRSIRYMDSLGESPKQPIDKRFFNLIAALGESEEKTLIPNNINILTYNYDCLLEEGICAMQVKNTDWFDSKRGIKPWPWNPEITEDTNIFHLNGIAGFGLYSADRVIQFIQDQSDKGDEAMHLKVLHDVDSTLEQIDNGGYDNPRFGEHIKFAWEVAENEPEAVEKFQEVMKKTDFLAIIGYSFPYFNRSLDRKLFNGLRDSYCKEITVVDPTFEAEHLINLFRADEIVPTKRLNTVKEIDQFYIPPDYDIR